MAEFKNILKGEIFFFVGYLYMLVMSYLVPPIIEAGNTIYSGSEVEAIGYLMLLIIYIFLAIIMPANFIYKGITAKSDMNPFMQIVLAIFIVFLGILLTVKGWFMIEALGNMAIDTVIKIFFWVGLISSWILGIVITPIAMIMQARAES